MACSSLSRLSVYSDTTKESVSVREEITSCSIQYQNERKETCICEPHTISEGLEEDVIVVAVRKAL